LDDPVAKQLLTELAVDSAGAQDYTLTNGIIYYKGIVWVGHNALFANMN
jgi:hypothetical protein